MDGFQTPEEAALHTMPARFTHVVMTSVDAEERSAYVLLATEVQGVGYYLDENVCGRAADGSWWGVASGGGGFTERTLEDLREDPPARGLWWSADDE